MTMSDSEIIIGYLVEFFSDGRAWRVVISDPMGADLMMAGERRKNCRLPEVFADRTTAKLAAFAFIRANVDRIA